MQFSQSEGCLFFAHIIVIAKRRRGLFFFVVGFVYSIWWEKYQPVAEYGQLVIDMNVCLHEFSRNSTNRDSLNWFAIFHKNVCPPTEGDEERLGAFRELARQICQLRVFVSGGEFIAENFTRA